MEKADGSVIIDTKIQTEEFDRGISGLKKAVSELTGEISSLGSKAKISLQRQMDSVEKLYHLYDRQQTKVKELRKSLEEYAHSRIPTDEYKEIARQIEQDTAKLNKLTEAQEQFIQLGGSEKSSVYKKRDYEMEQLTNSIRYAKSELKELEASGGAFIPGTETKQYQMDMQRLAVEEQKLSDMGNRLKTSYSALSQKINEYRQQASGASESTGNTASHMSVLENSFRGLRSVMRGAVSLFRTIVLNAPTKTFSLLRKEAGRLAASLLSIAKTGIASGFRKITAAVKMLTLSLTGLNKQTENGKLSMGRMLATSLLFGTVFRILSKVTDGIGEGFSNLAQYSENTNRSLSSLLSALTRLKNSFAAAFTPVLNVAAPILKAFINVVARAVTYVGALIAALTGQDSFVRAKEVQENYAASLENTADNYKKAEKAQNRYLSGLDEIRHFEEPDNNAFDTGSGGGYTAPTPGEMFETVPIENSLKNLADKIKEMWRRADFTDIGTTIVQKLKDSLDSIPWNRIKSTAEKVGKSFATLINGGVETSGLAGSVGRTAGKLLNTGISGADAFLKNLHFDSLGTFLADAVNRAIGTINFGAVGSLIADYLNGVFKLSETWSGKFDFKQLGIALRKLINVTLTGIDWKSAITAASNIGRGIAQAVNGVITPETFGNIGSAVAGAVRTVIAGVKSWVTATDFHNWGKSLGTALNHFFNGINWTEAGLTLDELIGGLVEFMEGLVNSGTFETFAEKIGTALSEVNWLGHLFKAGRAIADALKDILVGAASTPAGRFIEAVGAALLAVKLTSSLFKFVDDIATILGGDRNTRILKDKMESLLGRAAEDAAGTAAEKVKSFTDELEKAGGAVENTKEKTAGAKDEFGKFWGTALNFGASVSLLDLLGHQKATISDLEKATNKYNEAFGPVLQALMDLEEQGFITNKQIANIIPSSDELSSDIFSFSDSFQKVVDYLEEAGVSSEDFKNALSTALEESSGFSSEYSEEIRKYLGEVSNSFSSLAENSGIEFPGIEKNVGDAFKNVESISDEKWSNTYDSVLEAISGIDNDVKDVMTRVVTSMQLNWQSVVINTNQIWELIARKVDTELNNTLDSARQITSGIIHAFSDMNIYMTNIFTDFGYAIQRSMGNMYNIGHNAAQSFADGIRSVHIPMPHISVSSSTWSTGNGYSYSMDSWVNWYKMGGLFERPSVVGIGEAGKEAVLPLERSSVMRTLADSIVSCMNMNTLPVPYLSKGTVAPPKASRAAILGDQKQGNNIEAPEELLRKIVREELRGVQQTRNNTYTFVGKINRRTLFEEMMTEAELVRCCSGRNPFDM